MVFFFNAKTCLMFSTINKDISSQKLEKIRNWRWSIQCAVLNENEISLQNLLFNGFNAS